MNEPKPTGEVIDQQIQQVPDAVVNTGEGVTDDGQTKPKEDYFKNKAFEFERKYNATQQEFAKTQQELQEIKNLLKQNVGAKETYSEEQIDAALSSADLTPEQRAFAINEKRKIESKKQEARDQKLIDEIERRNRDVMTRQQAEQAVVNDPRFQEAFIKLPNGQVRWNNDNPLAQSIGAYMQDPRMANQPDALLIASKLAYADMIATKSQQELTQMKRQNEQLKGQTMVEGAGKNYNKPAVEPFSEAMKRLQAGDASAGKDAIKEYFRRTKATT